MNQAKKMKMVKDSGKFNIEKSWNKVGLSPVFKKHFQSPCKKSVVKIKICDYNYQSYFHLTRQDNHGGKSYTITLRPDELYNILDFKDMLIETMNSCDEAIWKNYGILPGTAEEEIQYETIPKSQRNMEREEVLNKNKEEEKLYQEFLKYKEQKRTETIKEVTESQSQTEQQQEEEEDEDEDDDDQEEEAVIVQK